jgi:hypothetical protein
MSIYFPSNLARIELCLYSCFKEMKGLRMGIIIRGEGGKVK